MATVACKIVNGMLGYVPVKNNSHGGTDLGRAYNNAIVYMYTDRPVEEGYVQVDKRIVDDLDEIKVSETGEYWIEKSHLEPLAVPPPVTGEKTMVVTGFKWSKDGIELTYKDR